MERVTGIHFAARNNVSALKRSDRKPTNSPLGCLLNGFTQIKACTWGELKLARSRWKQHTVLFSGRSNPHRFDSREPAGTATTSLFIVVGRKLERVTGIEPASGAWKAPVLPLNYTRNSRWDIVPQPCARIAIVLAFARMVGVTGFEPATSCSQSRRATKLRHTPTQAAFTDYSTQD